MQGTLDKIKRRMENGRNITNREQVEGHELDAEKASDKPRRGHDIERDL
jgi:hypothetical protein